MTRKREVKQARKYPYDPAKRQRQKENRQRKMNRGTINSKSALTMYETAFVLGMGEQTVFRMHKSGELPTFKVGRRVYCSRKALEHWVEEKVKKAAQERVAAAG